MKSINDIKLEAKVSDMILKVVQEAKDGKFDGVDYSDIAGMCEALAMNIIKTVRKA